MEDSIIRKNEPTTESVDLREKLLNAEELLKTVPGSMIGDCFPLKHTFGDGLYVREIRVPKDSLVITKIHKVAHPYFVLSGEISVLTEKGAEVIKAPYYGITPAGTKRACYCHTDTVWVTVHRTNETDLDKIEKEIIAENFDETLPDHIKNAVTI